MKHLRGVTPCTPGFQTEGQAVLQSLVMKLKFQEAFDFARAQPRHWTTKSGIVPDIVSFCRFMCTECDAVMWTAAEANAHTHPKRRRWWRLRT